MILWSDPAHPKEDFMITIDGPDRSGWHEALVHFPNKKVFEKAMKILKEQGYAPPRDRWNWERRNVTYMRRTDTYYALKLRHSPQGEEEE